MSDAPQVENGYTRLANELLDAIVLAPLSKREYKIVLAVVRKTYGFGKKSDDMTMTQLAKVTGLTRAHVSETVHELAQKNVFLIQDGNYGKVIALSKNYRNWNFKDRPKTGPSQNGTRPETGTAPSQNGNNCVPKREIHDPETGHTKETPKRKLQKKLPKERLQPPPVTAPAWAAYASAYQLRYGVEPVRNAKVNKQLSEVVKRIGADDAPHVAAFFVGHNSAYYVRRGHAVGVLLTDAEKLRTEWATNTRMTETRARQQDKTETSAQVWTKLLQETAGEA